jgi:nitroreductase
MAAESTLTVREAAESRRDIRKYLQEEVPEADLREILRQTRLAPSPDNFQPWRFVVVRDPELRAGLVAAARSLKQVASAHALIVLYADMEDVLATVDEMIHPGFDEKARARVRNDFLKTFGEWPIEERQRYAHGQAYVALGYLLLSAQAMGYSTSPMLGFYPDKVKEVLGLPSHVTIPALVSIGRGDEPGFPHHRHSVERIARFR